MEYYINGIVIYGAGMDFDTRGIIVDQLIPMYEGIGGTLYIAIMHEKEDAFDEVIRRMGHYVDNRALGDETIIRPAGTGTASQPASSVMLSGE